MIVLGIRYSIALITLYPETIEVPRWQSVIGCRSLMTASHCCITAQSSMAGLEADGAFGVMECDGSSATFEEVANLEGTTSNICGRGSHESPVGCQAFPADRYFESVLSLADVLDLADGEPDSIGKVGGVAHFDRGANRRIGVWLNLRDV